MTNEAPRYVLENLNVLVVDDNRHMSRFVSEILRGLGIRNILEMTDATKAIAELKHFSADMIFLDWMMQPMDGLDFTRRIRTAEDSPNPYVPIIMISAHTEMTRITEARDAGINEFIAKPVSPKAVYQRVTSVIDNPRAFIRSEAYFGPDRRRQNQGPPHGVPERRTDES